MDAGRAQPGTSGEKRVPTARQRYLAAKIRVRADEKLGRDTPRWIVAIANDGEKRFGR